MDKSCSGFQWYIDRIVTVVPSKTVCCVGKVYRWFGSEVSKTRHAYSDLGHFVRLGGQDGPHQCPTRMSTIFKKLYIF